MNANEVKQLFLEEKLVVISRKMPTEKLGNVAKALVAGGVKLLEVTFDQLSDDPARDYREALDAIRAAVGDQLCLGAGTILNEHQLRQAYKAGARFYLSPNMRPGVIFLAKELGMVAIPGAMTPTEIVDAWEAGADIIKLFPADDLGYHYIWNLRGPLPHIPLLASGGVNPQTIPKFFDQGVAAVGTGMSIINRDMVNADDYAGIEALAREHVRVIREYYR